MQGTLTLCSYLGPAAQRVTKLPYVCKRKQVTKVTFLVKEQNVSVIYTAVNGISLSYLASYYYLFISYKDECFCMKFGLKEKLIM